MSNRSETDGELGSQNKDETDTEAAEIPKRAGIAAGMFFPVVIVLAVAAVVIIYFVVM